MKQTLVRINSIDNIEMVGILYEPENRSSNSCSWFMWKFL